MANINIRNISDLDLSGNNLFEDSESFMIELSEDDGVEAIYGGDAPLCLRPSCAEVSCIRGSQIDAFV